MDLGSCQYSEIGDTVDNILDTEANGLNVDLNIVTINAINIQDILPVIKFECIKNEIENHVEYGEEAKDTLDSIITINNIDSIESLFNHLRNSSWDLWSAAGYISNHLNIPDIDSNTQIGEFIYYLLSKRLVPNDDCFGGLILKILNIFNLAEPTI